MNNNKKPLHDFAHPGEHKIGKVYYFDSLEVPISEVCQRKDEIKVFLGNPSIQGHLTIDVKCIEVQENLLFTVIYLMRSL